MESRECKNLGSFPRAFLAPDRVRHPWQARGGQGHDGRRMAHSAMACEAESERQSEQGFFTQADRTGL